MKNLPIFHQSSWIGSLLVVCCTLSTVGFGQSGEGTPILFAETIKPIFATKCIPCHGPATQRSGYRLDVRSIAFSGGDRGESPIVPGRVEASLLLQYVSSPDSEMAMPPKDSQAQRLTAAEVQSLRNWIGQGAEWPDSESVKVEDPLDWWSLKPLQGVTLLSVTVHSSDANPIDTFITSTLAEKGLAMSPAAEARTLARRLYFDLIGLPPSPEELDTFELHSMTNAEAAYDALVERLLGMPQYGERWARHWLDVVHYGDTHGYDKDKPRPNAWPYRDYVIRAFNEDKPYSRFIEEQIAGDVLWPGTRDGIEALGFIAAGPWDFIGHAEVAESKTDGKIARHLDRDDMVSNTIGSFCSVTIHCAQCHQHKFDPVSQEDYYRLHAVFSALDRTDRKYYPNHEMQQQFLSLERAKREVDESIKQIEAPLIKSVGEEYPTLTKRIENARKSTDNNPNQGVAYGYHSGISPVQEVNKWVQVDLGDAIEISRITLRPCYDDFNSIGSGFGFPIRFKVEACKDVAFKDGVVGLSRVEGNTFSDDFKNPGIAPVTFQASPVTFQASEENLVVARYIRVTASKLASRQNDFIFALAELQAFNSKDTNIALGRDVSALDSIEAAPRWRLANLTDGNFPETQTVKEKQRLVQERESLLLRSADAATKMERAALLKRAQMIFGEMKKLPEPNQVYVGGIHTGSGTFVGTGSTGGKPRPIHLLARGQVTQPTSEMTPGALSALQFRPFEFVLPQDHSEGERRVALAHWITDRANPLTWRSIVNRVWQYHFGRGFVDTPNDLGRNGGIPSHVELLDWLAADFRDSGGSLKRLHRMIVKSKAYRQSSTSDVAGERIDSNNTLLWRQNRRRLEAEAIRDSVLFVSGKLGKAMGGPGWKDFVVEYPEHSPHYEYGLADPEDPTTWRRSIYRFIVRSQTQPWMTSLDCADPSMRVDKRNESLSPIQSLALLNNGFMLSQAKHFAARVQSESDDLAEQVELAHRLALGMSPTNSARTELIEFAKQNGMPYLCRVLFNLNAFTFVD